MLSMLWYSVTITTSLAMIIYLSLSKRLKPNFYVWWIVIFNMWGTLSIFWTLDQNYTMNFVRTAFAQMIIMIPLSMLIRNKNDLFLFLKLVVFAILVTSVYLFVSIDRSIIGQTRISDEGWNANNIGMMTAIAIVLSLAIIKNGVKKCYYLLYLLTICFLIYVCVFTGSRKSFFILIVGTAFYIYLATQKRKTLVLPGMIAFVLISYFLVMNQPELFKVLGIRIEGLLNQLTGEGVVDRSTWLRMLMIDNGITWFRQKPFIGYGMNNYKVLLGEAVGLLTYAHNNYIELLVGVGIIGTAIYYYIYVHTIRRLLKSVHSKDLMAVLFFVLMLVMLIIDYGLVSYSSPLIQLILCFGYVATKMVDRSYAI